MKRIWSVLAVCVLLGACASVDTVKSCQGRSLKKPSYFAQGQQLAAFRAVLGAYGNRMEGILQIKKIDADSYGVTLFAPVGGYRLMQAVVTQEGVGYSYLVPEADKAVVRNKAEAFLKLLLFAPTSYKNCKEKNGVQTVSYEGGLKYEYVSGAQYPRSLVHQKALGSERMEYAEYTPYENAEVPHILFYQDGSLEGELILISLKK